MKLRLLALMMILSLVVWAQGTPAPSAPNSAPAPDTKSCCHHSHDAKAGEGCCHHAKADGKEASGCCGKDTCEKKDAKSCCAGTDMKACREQCKKDGCCSEGKGCCGSDKEKTAAGCCKGNGCPRHPQTQSGN